LLDIPTVVAVRTRRSGKREVIAVGEEARAMIGRTPEDVEAVRPVRQSRIVEYDVADALLLHLARITEARGGWTRPNIAVAVPQNATEMALRAVRDSCEAFRPKEVTLMPSPIAAAMGCDLNLAGTAGHMLVDVGAGTTEIAVMCMNEVITATTLEIGGDVLDGAIIRALRRDHALLVGPITAERIKQEIGAAAEPDSDAVTNVYGRCLRQGIPRSVQLSSYEVSQALREPVAAIGAAVRRVLEQTPPEIASDVVDHGVILCGGASQLRNLDLALRADTGLAILPAIQATSAVVVGAGQAMQDQGLQARLAS
jgi:rod shape-determining protein MreB